MSDRKPFNIPMHLMRGIGIFLVVYAHTLGTTYNLDPTATWTKNSFDLVYSFHMHLFFFVSGFFGRKLIDYEPGSYRTIAVGQLQRLGVVYLFYTALAIVMKLGMSGVIHRPIEWSRLPADVFVYPNRNPMMSLWFIYTLLLVQLAFLTFNTIMRPRHEQRLTRVLFITFLLAVNLGREWMPNELGINYFAEYGLYFYLGYLASRRPDIEPLLKRWRVPILLAALFYAFYAHLYFDRFCDARFCRLIYASIGITTVWTASLHLAETGGMLSRFFHVLADYSYEIYLNSPFFGLPLMRLYDRLLGWSMTAAFPPFVVISLLLPIPLTHYVYRRWSLLRRLACGMRK